MELWALLAIAVGLGMDALAVAAGAGVKLCRVSLTQMLRMSLAFGGFQFFMPLAGWQAGEWLLGFFSAMDHWIAFGLLAAVGGHMIWGATRHGQPENEGSDPTTGWRLFALAIATSIDALAVGVSFSLLRVNILSAAAVIGVVAAGMTVLGLAAGCRLGERFGARMEILGGLVLVGIGVKIVVEHWTG